MTDAELEQLLPDLESDRVERKESAADATKIRQAICGFDEQRLNEKRRYRDVPFDLHPVDSANPGGLDELVFRRVYLPSDWLPGAYVQFLRVDGTELGEPVRDAREVRGPLPDPFAELEEVLRANVRGPSACPATRGRSA